MDELAWSDLVARVRRSAVGTGSEGIEAELVELERRARAFGATDEELTLAVFALLASTQAGARTP